MTQDPRLRPDPSAAEFPRTDSVQDQKFSLPEGAHDISTVARTLVAYGGGDIAFDLALDLVLNQVVEQARSSTGATGAAIAIARNGEMECRATTGQHAPDLGIRIETESGLSAACLRSGEVQNCVDTDADARVDAEACRQLGVRSILIVPLLDGTHPFGILEVLSPRPNAFGIFDIETLKSFALRIAASKKEAELDLLGTRVSGEEDTHVLDATSAAHQEAVQTPNAGKSKNSELEAEPANNTDLWTTVLVVLVIAAAVALGVVIGWRGAAKKWISGSQVRTNPESAAATVSAETSLPPTPPVAVSRVENLGTESVLKKAPPTPTEMGGGLVVTQNGKIIYRETAKPQGGSNALHAARLLHRVEPQYPAEARNQRIQGAVILDVQVLRDGSVGTIGIASGDPLLAEAAVHAVRQWKYQPNLVNGRPVESQSRITINFTLPTAN